jgi:O-antigen/teichoic acid export membrane protein
MSLIVRWKRFLDKGHERTVRAKKNVILAMMYKYVGVFIGFLYFPLSLSYLDPVRYGIFLTLASMIDWFGELDVGIGSGMRNRLGEALADGDDERARAYVSTAYFFVGTIFSVASVLFMVASYFLPWSSWLQADPNLNRDIAILAMFMFAAFAINFVSSLIYEVFYALQRTAMVNFFNMITKVSFLLMILYLLYFTEGSLVLYGAAKTLTFALIPLSACIIYFGGSLKKYRPTYRLVKRKYFKDLFSLGFRFFVIKISILIIYQSNNFLIARFASLEGVSQYNAVYKLLSIFLMFFVIVTNQLWSANLEAYRKGEMEWIRKTLNSLKKVWGATILLSVVMVLFSPFFFELWLQDKLQIPFMLTVAVAVSVGITNWVNMHNLVINGTGKVKLQMLSWVGVSILNVPISYFFAVPLGLGTNGVVLGTIVSLLPLTIISPIQVRKITHHLDRGIWSK